MNCYIFTGKKTLTPSVLKRELKSLAKFEIYSSQSDLGKHKELPHEQKITNKINEIWQDKKHDKIAKILWVALLCYAHLALFASKREPKF